MAPPVAPPRCRRQQGRRKSLICALLAISLQALPLEIRPAPDAEPVLGTPPAAAQSTPTIEVRDGVPSPCPDTNGVHWSPVMGDADWATAPECTLELPACPESPLHTSGTGFFMRLSSLPVGLDASRFPVGFQNLNEYSYDIGSGEAALPNYPDFCELRVTWDDVPRIDECRNATGHVVSDYRNGGPTPTDTDCRLLRPLACADGLQFVTSKICRGVQRRAWSCGPDEPHNHFNKCLVEMAGSTGSNPACASNWPQLPLSSCEAYVGGDYLPGPTADCATGAAYDTGTPVPEVNQMRPNRAIPSALPWPLHDASPATSLGVPATVSNHWCSYDARALRSECHGAAATRPDECTARGAIERSLCIKRGSGVGGCAAVAQTIKCRAFEQAFVETPVTVPLDYVRVQRCSPCLALPFRPIPPQCPPDMHGPAEIGGLHTTRSGMDRETHPDAESAHLAGGSRHDRLCEDPPAGRLRSSPAHSSGLAVVNSRVIVTLDGVDLEQRRTADLLRVAYNPDFRPGSPEFGDAIVFTEPSDRRRLDEAPYQTRYATGSADQHLKTWLAPDPAQTYAQLQDIAGEAECYAEWGPTFRLVVQELWPDRGGTAFTENDPLCSGATATGDAATILDLFGDDSLGWWCDLDNAGREQRTTARGIAWWPDFSARTFPPPRTAELERDAAMTTTLPCAFGMPTGVTDPQGSEIWCQWIPRRPGFYRLHAGGAWPMRRSTGVRSRTTHAEMQHILDYFNDPAEGQQRRRTVNSWLFNWRTYYGLADRTWDNMGLEWLGESNPVDVLPEPTGWTDGYWYEAGNVALTSCPPIDLRVRCTSDPVIDYTETEPIGVMVYEARVVTRAPS